jgi:hypothetical protein
LRFCACSARLTYSSSPLKWLDSWSSTYKAVQADSWSSHSLIAAAPAAPRPRRPPGDSGGNCCCCWRLAAAVGVPLLLSRCRALLSAARSVALMWL